jgi:poly-beta-1,6-N-acetyl-D-glucosamine synthase
MQILELVSIVIAGAAFLGILNVYVLYPISLIVLRKMSNRRQFVQRSGLYPSVAMLCAAHNEDQVIRDKIANFLALEYPPDKLFLYIGSDGSTDRTNEILRSFRENDRIRVRYFERRGKGAVVNELIQEIDAEIVVFSDANTIYHKDSVAMMVRRFDDPSVGGVCGNLFLTAPKQNAGMIGEEKYWLIETWLKKMESSIHSLIGATGGIYAIRRVLYEQQPVDRRIADDLLLPMRIAAKKYRIVFEEDAHAFEDTNADMFLEFHRRVRNAVGSIAVLSFWSELSPGYNLFFKYSFLSHKLLRWLIPFILLAFFFSTGILAFLNGVFLWLFALQLLLYGIGILGIIAEKFNLRTGVLMLPAYFVLANSAVFLGWFKRSSLGKQATWPTHRSGSPT